MIKFFQKLIFWIHNVFFSDILVPTKPSPILNPTPTPTPPPVVQTPPPINKLNLWMEAIKEMEGARPDRNNPGNLKFRGQQYAVNNNGFCKFDTYEHGYQALKNLLINACTGKSKFYYPTMSLYQFQEVYSPANDGNNPNQYAEFVARKIGVPPTTEIKDLIV